MVSTPFRSRNLLIHTRSVSLPTRSHPLIPQFNDHIQRVRPCDSSTPSPLPSIAKKLNNLEDMYNCVDDLLLLPHTRQVFARDLKENWVEESLEGFLGLVDACATAKDFAFQVKLDVQGLLSVLRRRRDVDDLCVFLNSRKHTKKTIQKSLRSVGSFRNKHSVFGLDKDQETIAVISMLKEAESVTFDIIEVLLSSVSGTKSSGWSLISRLIKSRKSSGNVHSNTPEFEELDAILYKIFGYNRTSKGDAGVDVDELMHLLKEMDSRIQVVEERLECLFKRLIKTRVSLLNMQSQ